MIFNRGDLVLVPASVNLFSMFDEAPIELTQTKTPEYAILLNKRDDGFVEIYLGGKYFLVSDDSIYEIGENKCL